MFWWPISHGRSLLWHHFDHYIHITQHRLPWKTFHCRVLARPAGLRASSISVNSKTSEILWTETHLLKDLVHAPLRLTSLLNTRGIGAVLHSNLGMKHLSFSPLFICKYLFWLRNKVIICGSMNSLGKRLKKRSFGLMDHHSFLWWQTGFCLYPIRPWCSYSAASQLFTWQSQIPTVWGLSCGDKRMTWGQTGVGCPSV